MANARETTDPTREWLSAGGVGELAGCSVSTVKRRRQLGLIVGYRMPGSRQIRYRRDEILAALRPIPAAERDDLDSDLNTFEVAGSQASVRSQGRFPTASYLR